MLSLQNVRKRRGKPREIAHPDLGEFSHAQNIIPQQIVSFHDIFFVVFVVSSLKMNVAQILTRTTLTSSKQKC